MYRILQYKKTRLRPHISEDKKNIDDLIKKAINQLMKLNTLYLELPVERKLKLLSSIFPENITFSENKYLTPRLNEVILLYLNTNTGLTVFTRKKAFY